jgi:hypothetical protein
MRSEELLCLFAAVAWKERGGGSPRIYAGELGFQAEPARVALISSGFSRGVSESSFPSGKRGTPGLKPDEWKYDSFRDAEASLPPAEAGGSHPDFRGCGRTHVLYQGTTLVGP